MEYNVNLNVKSRKCVIIGGGTAAALKAQRLISAGAEVYITAPRICDKCRSLNAIITEKEYRRGDTDGAFIVFALTDNDELNSRIKADAKMSGALTGGEDFSVVASHSGKNMTVCVQTGYPKLSAKLAEELLAYDTVAGILAQYRKDVFQYTDNENERAALLNIAVTDDMLAAALSSPDKFRDKLIKMLKVR